MDKYNISFGENQGWLGNLHATLICLREKTGGFYEPELATKDWRRVNLASQINSAALPVEGHLCNPCFKKA